MRIKTHGVGVSKEFKNTELRTLLFELEQVTNAKYRPYIQRIRSLFEELIKLAPQTPFRDSDPPDPQKVQLAQSKFAQITREWQRLEEF